MQRYQEKRMVQVQHRMRVQVQAPLMSSLSLLSTVRFGLAAPAHGRTLAHTITGTGTGTNATATANTSKSLAPTEQSIFDRGLSGL
jgi:uncharacterized protein (DUF697 family)